MDSVLHIGLYAQRRRSWRIYIYLASSAVGLDEFGVISFGVWASLFNWRDQRWPPV